MPRAHEWRGLPSGESGGPSSERPFRNSLSGVQPSSKRLGLFQIERVEVFSESAVDRARRSGLILLTLIAA